MFSLVLRDAGGCFDVFGVGLWCDLIWFSCLSGL